MRLAAILPLLAVLTPVATLAQGPAIDISRLQFGTDSMSITVIREGQKTPVGQLWDTFVLDSSSATPLLRRVYRTINRAFGPHLDTTLVQLPGLQPFWRRTRAQLFQDSLGMTAGRVLGWRKEANRAPVPVDRALSPSVIDAALFDAAVRAAPLGPGYRLQLQGYSLTQDSVLTLGAVVTGEDNIVQRDGTTVAVWIVTMDFGGLPSTMWIAKSSRAMVRQTIDLTPSFQMLMER